LLVFQFLVAIVVKVLELPIKSSGQKDRFIKEYWKLQPIWPYWDGRCAGGDKCIFIAGGSGTPQTLLLLRKTYLCQRSIPAQAQETVLAKSYVLGWAASNVLSYTSS